jgi:hypothetical protein
MKIDILDLIDNAKRKSDKLFLELFYNRHFKLSTDKRRMINSAYEYKDIIGLNIQRRDYSNVFDITLEQKWYSKIN